MQTDQASFTLARSLKQLLVLLQVNARKVYDEASVLAGIFSNNLFLTILLGEASLQVSIAVCLLRQ